MTDDIPLGALAITSPIPAATDGMRLRIRERLADGTILEIEEDENEDGSATIAAGGGATAGGGAPE